MRNTNYTTKKADITTCKNCKNCICNMNCKTFSVKADLFNNSKLVTVQVLCTLDKMHHVASKTHEMLNKSQREDIQQITKSLLENFLPKLVSEIQGYEKGEEKTLSKEDADFVYAHLENTLIDYNLVQEFENMYNLKDTSKNLYRKVEHWYPKAREKFFKNLYENL